MDLIFSNPLNPKLQNRYQNSVKLLFFKFVSIIADHHIVFTIQGSERGPFFPFFQNFVPMVLILDNFTLYPLFHQFSNYFFYFLIFDIKKEKNFLLELAIHELANN